ncbi:UNVERIFIED_CONTAM: hypothetical protein Sradi_1882200 [Sesamum radiatum]|uniref:Endonuclease/exonuclease/phosphatase domain-containing protein n=1 Tax=Sesamum radiatum TaxID=300843 RepID=A0AAW2TYA6_SESRA
MITLVCNCRGIGGPRTVRQLGEYIRKHQPSIVFLMETKCGKRRFEYLKNKFDMFGICSLASGRSGGLILLWRNDTVVQLRTYSKDYIDVEIYDPDVQNRWRFTGFYGHPDANQRHQA